MTRPQPLAYVISPQPWAGFQVSKHHYAIALAHRGWRVVFIDPPVNLGQPGRIEITPTEIPSVRSLRYQTFFPHKVKFHLRWLFDRLMHFQSRRLVAAAGRPDLVWDFDNAYQFRDLRSFGAQTTLFHLVDDVGKAGSGTKGADHLFYLHASFCTRAGGVPQPDHEIGHGLGRLHESAALKQDFGVTKPGYPRVGFVGNLAAAWIDWAAIDVMLTRHPQASFTFWGPLPPTEKADPELVKVLAHSNAAFPGLTSPDRIVMEAPEIDVWLVPFSTDKVQGEPLNSHKVLEYLSTGKAVVMNWLEAYDGNPLVNILPGRDSTGLEDLLDAVLAELDTANAPEMMAARRAFALERSYDRHMEQIMRVAGLTAQELRTNAA